MSSSKVLKSQMLGAAVHGSFIIFTTCSCTSMNADKSTFFKLLNQQVWLRLTQGIRWSFHGNAGSQIKRFLSDTLWFLVSLFSPKTWVEARRSGSLPVPPWPSNTQSMSSCPIQNLRTQSNETLLLFLQLFLHNAMKSVGPLLIYEFCGTQWLELSLLLWLLVWK